MKGTLSFRIDYCKGCELCVNACPKNLLKISTEKINKKGHYVVELTSPDRCVGCGSCALMCPDCVIKVERE